MAQNENYQGLPYQPNFPEGSSDLGIGIIGCGGVAQKWHLTAYKKYGLKVVGVYDVSSEVLRLFKAKYPDIRIFASLDDLMSDPVVSIVDIATPPNSRPEIVRSAINHGKHVLAQKPFSHTLDEAYEIALEADKRGITVAVNQNGRWAPQWRLASLLIDSGEIGDIECVTHLYDTRMTWKLKSELPALDSTHFLTYDYSIHWVDITRCWLENKKLLRVWAQEHPSIGQFPDNKVSQTMWIFMEYDHGINAMIRGIACAYSHSGHPFWIHGTKGTIRGSVDTLRGNSDSRGGDYIELDKKGTVTKYYLEGNWFPDGFAGTMGELMCSIIEGREPYNSIKHNLLSLEATLAACRSVEQGGIPVSISRYYSDELSGTLTK